MSLSEDLLDLEAQSTTWLAATAAKHLSLAKYHTHRVEQIGAVLLSRLETDPEPEPVPEPVPAPTVPAEPVDPDSVFQAVQTIGLSPFETSYEQAKRISQTLKPGTRLLVPEDMEVEALKFGGGNHPITMADGSPVRDIEVTGGGTVKGIEFHQGIDGEVILRNLTLRPMHKHDQSPVRCVGMVPGLFLTGVHLRILGTEGATSWGGFGMKQGMILQGCSASLYGLDFDPSQEHSLYAMNLSHLDFENAINRTTTINGFEVGNGRTFFVHQNRIADAKEAVGGPPSSGQLTLRELTAVRCGHEGLLQGYAPSGGSDFTIAGHTGTVAMMDLLSGNPYCGGIAVWGETHYSEESNANPLGVRCWTTDGEGKVYHPNEAVHYAVDGLVVDGYEVLRSDVPEGRTPVLISGVGSGWLNNVPETGIDIGHQSVMPTGPVEIHP